MGAYLIGVPMQETVVRTLGALKQAIKKLKDLYSKPMLIPHFGAEVSSPTLEGIQHDQESWKSLLTEMSIVPWVQDKPMSASGIRGSSNGGAGSEVISITQDLEPESQAFLADETDDLSKYVHEVAKVLPGLGGLLYPSTKPHDELHRPGRRGVATALEGAFKQDDAGDGGWDKGWKQPEEQMFRRWELLALCYSKMGGDRKLACDAFVESVKASPYGSSGLEHPARSATSTNDFSANAGTKQLGGIIDKLTYTATCDLFLPTSEVSLHTALKPGIISDEISTRKDSVQTIATVLALRRARVLLKCMELLCKDGNANDGETCWTVEHLGEEVLNLLTVERRVTNDFDCVISCRGDPKTKLSPAHAKKSLEETLPAKKPTRAASACLRNRLPAVLPDKVPRAALENVSNIIQSVPPKQASAMIAIQEAVIVFDLETMPFAWTFGTGLTEDQASGGSEAHLRTSPRRIC
ncbi:hypothetical protein EV702DRAFT_1270701 [Suillus placidus]|uniref:Uncharacterized protein n=1 Tax=Suillus placidus TaxID=48579 RepID=A0A9P6ZM92_9AGAM|nr:hypothetical protein EV702DRAFT_1270701 [Suillus placidus]